MNRKKISVSFGIVIILLVWQVQAVEIDIEIRPSFKLGEEVIFNYTIFSPVEIVVEYHEGIYCDSVPLPLFQIKTISLEPNVHYVESYEFLEVDDSIESQTCTAYVEIVSPEFQVVEETIGIFSIPSFEFSIKLDKRVFVQGEEIYLDYESEISDISLEASLTFPDETTQELTLPIPLGAEQIGTYELEVVASKEGYQTITKKEQFGVIEEEVEIENVDVASLGGGQKGVTWQETKDFFDKWWIWVVGGVVILVIVLGIIYWFSKGEKKLSSAKKRKREMVNLRVLKDFEKKFSG